MGFRLNAALEDLSFRFDVSVATVSDVIQKWTDVMHVHLQCLVSWPSQEIVHKNMLRVYRDLYSRAHCNIDFSELFIELPVAYQTRAQTYSIYKQTQYGQISHRYFSFWSNIIFVKMLERNGN